MSNAPGAPSEPVEPIAWQKGIAPRYIAVFLSILYLDQLAPGTLAVGGLLSSIAGAFVAGLLAYLLLFLVPATWGLKARAPLDDISRSTFGQRGARWIPGVLLGLAQILWFALALFYATDLAFRTLSEFGLLDPGHLRPIVWRDFPLAGPLFLWVAFSWSIASALIGTLAFRLVAAVMAGYQAFPALALGLVAVWAMPWAGGFRPWPVDPVTAEPVQNGGWTAFTTMIQMVFGFFATQGAMAADWGAASRDARDVRMGGLVGVACSSFVLASLGLLVVAGSLGKEPPPPGLVETREAQDRLERALEVRGWGPQVEPFRREILALGAEGLTIRGVLQKGLGGWRGGVLLLIFDLALLGPACFTPFVIGRRFSAAWPSLPRWAWSMIGAVATWPLIAFRVPLRLALVFGLLGAAFAPVVGAMAADFLRHRTTVPGPRRGINIAGWTAWTVGFLVGLLPVTGSILGRDGWSQVQPASVLAFIASFVTYLILALVGFEPPEVSLQAVASPATESRNTAEA